MRVKQTARKSTATTSGTGQPQGGRDPVRERQSALLQTKRKSLTPSQRALRSQQHGAGMGKTIKFPPPGGKKIPGVKIKPRHRSGELALKEIKRLQNDHKLQIPRVCFHKLVREITQQIVENSETLRDNGPLRYQAAALIALQEAVEAYLVQYFEDSYLCTLHAKRVTLFVSDMQLCRRLQRHRGYF